MNRIAHNRKDETGKIYGKLTVLEHSNTGDKVTYWKCLCQCGNITIVSGPQLRRKDDRKTTMCLNCGKVAYYKHGHTKLGGYQSPTYCSWNSMLGRCKRHENYLRNNITVCERWHDFVNFLEDMGERPKNHTIDRINTLGNYCKENCRWATDEEQNFNKITTKRVTINGETRLLVDWLKHFNMSKSTYYSRIHKGQNEIDALNTPINRKFNPHSILIDYYFEDSLESL